MLAAALNELEEREEFVDYYAMLQVPPEADARQIQLRIFDLYEEAQRNLDHRNHRKRFYYTTLYETHLARARHFLLEPARRARYDELLHAFDAGQTVDFETLVEKTANIKDAPARLVQTPVTQKTVTPATTPTPIVPPAAPPVSPAKETPATISPDAKTTKPAALQTPAAQTSVPPAPVAKPVVTAVAQGAQQNEQQSAESRAEAARIAKILRAAPALELHQKWDERRRDARRRELISAELRAQGRLYATSVGAVVVAIGGLILLKVAANLSAAHEGVLGAPEIVLLVLAFALICGIAWACGWQASRWARRRIIGTLSKMPYDELLLRFAPKFKKHAA